MDLEKSVIYILIVDSILKWNWECQWFEVSIKNPFFSFLIVSQTGRQLNFRKVGRVIVVAAVVSATFLTSNFTSR